MMSANELNTAALAHENKRFAGTGGVSAGNRHQGFRPAFIDRDTGRVFLSRFRDGRPACCHLLDGLPDDLTERDASGRVRAAKASVASGFVLGERFYTREQAALAAQAQAESPPPATRQ